MGSMYWESPDGTIRKSVISPGIPGVKPTEGTKCKVKISESNEDISQYSNIVIGDVDHDLGRQFEICLTMMFKGEVSKFVVKLDREVVFTIELLDMEFNGFLYKWDARRKYEYAVFQKEKGNTHFVSKNFREAGFRFNKGIKIMSSIPLDAQDPPQEVDGVLVREIEQLKATLYNNLASCFFKKEQWSLVIDFSDKVFIYDEENVKALYRASVAHIKDQNFEKADEYLKKVLEKDPKNQSAVEYHKFVKVKLKEAKEKCDMIAKKMISGFLNS